MYYQLTFYSAISIGWYNTNYKEILSIIQTLIVNKINMYVYKVGSVQEDNYDIINSSI